MRLHNSRPNRADSISRVYWRTRPRESQSAPAPLPRVCSPRAFPPRTAGGRVRILINLFRLAIGGSQINAIESGSRVSKRGHEVIVYAPDGELRERIGDLGLEVVGAGPARRHHPPTVAGVRRLTALARERKVDLIHAYEWSPTLEAAYGPHLRLGVPVLSPVYAVAVPRFVPRTLPMIVGYPNEADRERRRGRREVHVVVCPVDTAANAPVAD